MNRPKTSNSLAEQEMDKIQKASDNFNEQVQAMTLDRLNAAPKEEVEQQTKMSNREMAKAKDVYLKPTKSIGDGQKFNETFRDEWNFRKEYVQFIAEHKELIGEKIEIWTHPYGGVDAQFWTVPTNKPIWGPRYLAEQIRKKKYSRLKMEDRVTQNTGDYAFSGAIVVDTQVQRLDAYPVNTNRSVFMSS